MCYPNWLLLFKISFRKLIFKNKINVKLRHNNLMEHNSSSEILIHSIGEKFPVFNIRNITVFNTEGSVVPIFSQINTVHTLTPPSMKFFPIIHCNRHPRVLKGSFQYLQFNVYPYEYLPCITPRSFRFFHDVGLTIKIPIFSL